MAQAPGGTVLLRPRGGEQRVTSYDLVHQLVRPGRVAGPSDAGRLLAAWDATVYLRRTRSPLGTGSG
jgi:hypothetical protein